MPSRAGRRLTAPALMVLTFLAPTRGAAQSDVGPIPPAVAAEDDLGRVALRAVRLERPLEIDGQLDEPIYSAITPIDKLIQQVPKVQASADCGDRPRQDVVEDERGNR